MLNRIRSSDLFQSPKTHDGRVNRRLGPITGVLLLSIACGSANASIGPTAAIAPSGLTARMQAADVSATPFANVVDDCWSEPGTAVPFSGEGGNGTMAQYTAAPAMKIDAEKHYTAKLETNKGDIEVEFFPKDAPQTVNNFICLADDGYYNGTPFHRIIKGFMIQGGDPTGTGSGGPGYQFNDEPVSRNYTKGILAMANAGPNTNGSQFFIMHGDTRLPPNYTIFGQVISGLDIVDAIADTPTTGRENSTPTEAITLERVTVSQD